VDLRELTKLFLALRREFEYHPPAIVLIGSSSHKAGQFAPFAELDGGMVSKAHHVGDVGDRNQSVVGRPGDLQQKLVLLGLEAGCSGGLLAELQESTNLVPEFGKELNLVAIGFAGLRLHHKSIVTRYYLRRRSEAVSLSREGLVCGL
jgi:hypothetical protein